MNSQVRKIFLLFLFWVLILFALGSQAKNVIKIHDPNQILLAGKDVNFLEDPDGNFILKDILDDENQRRFIKHDGDVFSRPGTNSAFWFKITVQNHCDEDAWLEVGSNYAWYIDFYQPDSSGNFTDQPIETGTMRPDENKLYDVNFFWLPLNKANDNNSKTYYLKINSGLTFELPLHVGTIRALSKNKSINDYLTASFIGIIIIMLLYNLFIYISTKDQIYIYYLGYLFVMAFSMPYANGYPFIQNVEFLFFDKEFWNSYFLVWHAPAYFFAGAFCIQYLKMKDRSLWLYRIIISEIIIITIIFPILNIIGFQFVELVNAAQIFILLFYSTCLISGYYFVFKGVKQAYFYALGWTFLILGAFVFFAVINGFLPFNPITRNALYLGVVLEVCLFSLALGNRLNILQKEKDKIAAEHFKFIEQQKEILEEKVIERTRELKTINEKLVQSNEELLLTTEQLDTQSKQLQETNHTKDRLFAIISHDLRSPINSLKGLMSLIWEQNISREEFFQFSKNIKKGVEHAHFMLNNLLNWANSQMSGMKTNPKNIELYQLLLENKLLQQELSENKNIEVSIELDKGIEIYADRDHLNLVLRNLLSNALKFTEAGGEVMLSAFIQESECHISVKDTGIGFEEHELPNIFTKSGVSQVGTQGEKGTGLGLILCKEFIYKNNGRLWIDSKKGVGTIINFTLPITQKRTSQIINEKIENPH